MVAGKTNERTNERQKQKRQPNKTTTKENPMIQKQHQQS